MKKNYKLALLAALGLASAASVSQAQTLYLGFNDAAGSSTAQNDYVISLGSASQFTTSSSFDLSSDFSASTFSTAFGSDSLYLNDVAAGVIGASINNTGNPGFAFQSGAFAGGFPSGSSYGNLVTDGSPTVGEYASSTSGGWSYLIAASPTAGGTSPSTTWTGTSTVDPMSYLSSGDLTEDLYEIEATTSGRNTIVTQLGEVGTLDINVNTGTLSYTGVDATPEPSTYALVGVGLLAFTLHRKFGLKKA